MTAPTFDDDVRRLLDLQETSKLIDAELCGAAAGAPSCMAGRT